MQPLSSNPTGLSEALKRAAIARSEAAHDIKVAGGEETLDPARILMEQNLCSTGQTVADLGVGTMPYFTLQAAKLVGKEGKIYIVDVQKQVLAAALNQLYMAGVRNVTSVWSDLEKIGATSIPPGTVDVAFIVNVLFQSKTPELIIAEAGRLLKKEGKLLIIDYIGGTVSFAPKDSISAEQVIEKALPEGFALEKKFSAGPHHWGVVLIKN
jgi:ubiquinone/menaquinone biosynthesis C-methylase UbiE